MVTITLIVVSGIFLFLIRAPFKTLITSTLGTSKLDVLLFNGLDIAFLILWLWFCFALIREHRYSVATGGRHYGQDKVKYKRSYSDLIEFFRDATKHKLSDKDFPAIKWTVHKGIVFGYINNRLICLPSKAEGNIVVYGPPGKGKTRSVAIPNAISFDGSVLAIDIKGDIYSFVSTHSDRKILRFCPDDPDYINNSLRCDPFWQVEKLSESNRKMYIENIASVFIPEPESKDGNGSEAARYYAKTARSIFVGACYLLAEFRGGWEYFSLPELIKRITSSEESLDNWIDRAKVSKSLVARAKLLNFKDNTLQNVASAYQNLSDHLEKYMGEPFDTLLSRGGTQLDLSLLDMGYDVYLQMDQEHLVNYAPVFSMLIQKISMQLYSRPDKTKCDSNRSILMLLDELPTLSFPADILCTNLATLRSKDVNMMLIAQNSSQFDSKYGENETRTIMGNCLYKVVLGCADVKSCEELSRLFGERPVLSRSNSESRSGKVTTGISSLETRERVFPPEDILDMAPSSLLLMFGGKYAMCKKLNPDDIVSSMQIEYINYY